jgi:hypothetical protein
MQGIFSVSASKERIDSADSSGTNTSHVWGGGPERAYPTEQDVLKKSCPLQKSSVLAHFLAMGSIVAP